MFLTRPPVVPISGLTLSRSVLEIINKTRQISLKNYENCSSYNSFPKKKSIQTCGRSGVKVFLSLTVFFFYILFLQFACKFELPFFLVSKDIWRQSPKKINKKKSKISLYIFCSFGLKNCKIYFFQQLLHLKY